MKYKCLLCNRLFNIRSNRKRFTETGKRRDPETSERNKTYSWSGKQRNDFRLKKEGLKNGSKINTVPEWTLL